MKEYYSLTYWKPDLNIMLVFFFHLSGWIHVRCERFHATGSTFMHKFQICKLVVLAVLPATLLRSLATFVHPSVSNLCQTRLFTFIGMS